MTLASLAVQLLNGLASASSLFLIAAGLTLIFGVTRIVNFAHGSFFMLGSAYTLLRGKHIRTDNFYSQWSPRRQGIIDTICYLVLFFPPLLALLYVTWDYFLVSFMRGERVVSSPWMPIIYPLKFTMPVTCVLLLLQGVAEFLRSIHAAKTGEWLPRPSLMPERMVADV